MAGAGAKLFTDGSVLNAAQVNTYLMDQTIMRFATTTARDAAFGGAGEPTLAEGMTCYIDADNSIYIYDGSTWVKTASASQPAGLVHLGTFTGNGTSTQIVCDNVFTTEFQNYRVVVSLLPAGVNFNAVFGNFLDLSGNQVGTSYYSSLYSQDYASGTTGFGTMRTSTTAFYIGWLPSLSAYLGASFDVFRPREAAQTIVTGTYAGVNSGSMFAGGQLMAQQIATTQFRGFRVLADTGSPNLTGTIRVYGYRD